VRWGVNAITGAHEWTFGDTHAGTHATTNESFADGPVDADNASMHTLRDAALLMWLGHLTAAAESRT
jgi:hypothetical protein